MVNLSGQLPEDSECRIIIFMIINKHIDCNLIETEISCLYIIYNIIQIRINQQSL